MNCIIFDINTLALAGFIFIPILILCKFMDSLSQKPTITKKPDDDENETPEMRSRRILGDDLYESQTKVVQYINELHKNDSYIIANLTTSYGIRKEGQMILSKLLPGDKVDIKLNESKDLIRITTKSECVGHVGVLNYDLAKELIKNNNITGVYIYKQNSYGAYPSNYYFVKIIIYYNSSVSKEINC